jgi:hypothetical protein
MDSTWAQAERDLEAEREVYDGGGHLRVGAAKEGFGGGREDHVHGMKMSGRTPRSGGPGGGRGGGGGGETNPSRH